MIALLEGGAKITWYLVRELCKNSCTRKFELLLKRGNKGRAFKNFKDFFDHCHVFILATENKDVVIHNRDNFRMKSAGSYEPQLESLISDEERGDDDYLMKYIVLLEAACKFSLSPVSIQQMSRFQDKDEASKLGSEKLSKKEIGEIDAYLKKEERILSFLTLLFNPDFAPPTIEDVTYLGPKPFENKKDSEDRRYNTGTGMMASLVLFGLDKKQDDVLLSCKPGVCTVEKGCLVYASEKGNLKVLKKLLSAVQVSETESINSETTAGGGRRSKRSHPREQALHSTEEDDHLLDVLVQSPEVCSKCVSRAADEGKLHLASELLGAMFEAEKIRKAQKYGADGGIDSSKRFQKHLKPQQAIRKLKAFYKNQPDPTKEVKDLMFLALKKNKYFLLDLLPYCLPTCRNPSSLFNNQSMKEIFASKLFVRGADKECVSGGERETGMEGGETYDEEDASAPRRSNRLGPYVPASTTASLHPDTSVVQSKDKEGGRLTEYDAANSNVFYYDLQLFDSLIAISLALSKAATLHPLEKRDLDERFEKIERMLDACFDSDVMDKPENVCLMLSRGKSRVLDEKKMVFARSRALTIMEGSLVSSSYLALLT